MLHCRDVLLLNHPYWEQIVDICEIQCGTQVSEDFGIQDVTGGANSAMVTRAGICSRKVFGRIQESSDEADPALQYLVVFPVESG